MTVREAAELATGLSPKGGTYHLLRHYKRATTPFSNYGVVTDLIYCPKGVLAEPVGEATLSPDLSEFPAHILVGKVSDEYDAVVTDAQTT